MARTGWLLMFAIVLSMCFPARADAMIGWWDWLDGLSGPGPFNHGLVIDHRLFCRSRPDGADLTTVPKTDDAEWNWKGAKDLACLTNDTRLVQSYIEVRGGWISTDQRGLFTDSPNQLVGIVTAHAVSGMFMRQIDPALAVGAGLGAIWFSGDQVEGRPTRMTFTPVSIAFLPFKLFARDSRKAGAVVIHMEEVGILGGFTATDFNSRSTSSFHTRGDLTRSVSVTFDVFSFVH
jgi:hypothetical protein